jgi:hypothetical protein
LHDICISWSIVWDEVATMLPDATIVKSFWTSFEIFAICSVHVSLFLFLFVTEEIHQVLTCIFFALFYRLCMENGEKVVAGCFSMMKKPNESLVSSLNT